MSTSMTTEPTADHRRPWWRWTVPAVLLVLWLISYLFAGSRVAALQDELVQAEADRGHHQEKVTVLEGRQAQHVQRATEKATGTETERLERDAETIGEFAKLMGTWKTSAEYDTARKRVMSTYDLEEDSDFMTEFMRPDVCNKSSNGTRYCMIDTKGLHSSVGEVEPVLQQISTTGYEYLVMVELKTHARTDPSATASRVLPVRMTVDARGRISDLEAISSVEPTQRSND